MRQRKKKTNFCSNVKLVRRETSLGQSTKRLLRLDKKVLHIGRVIAG